MDFWLLLGNSLADVLHHAYDLWLGNHLTSDIARRIRFKSLRVEADVPFMVQLDGDPAPPASKVEITIAPRALKVFVPNHSLDLFSESSRRFIYKNE
jgi:diacylglycerol kinase family enzyme